MPEGRRLWCHLSILAAAILALHLWLLAGTPRLQAIRPPLPWSTRNIAAPAVAPPLDSATAPAPTAPNTTTRHERVASRAPATSTNPTAAALQPSSPSVQSPPIIRAVAPPSARFHYLVTSHSRGVTSQGEAALQWDHDGSQYEAQLVQSAPGLRTRILRSAGLITAQGLAPLRFSDKARSEEATHFARDSGKLIFSSNRPDAILEPGAQDRLSVILQLGAMMAADASKFRQGTNVAVQTVTTREAQPWVFLVEGVEHLELPGGTVPALKLSREPFGPYDARLELWLAPGADYAPVRLRLTQPNGDWVDQQWSSTDKR